LSGSNWQNKKQANAGTTIFTQNTACQGSSTKQVSHRFLRVAELAVFIIRRKTF
jgi:hypothetical protein